MNYCSCSKLTKLYKIVDKRKFADYNEIVVRTKVFRVNSERLFFCFILLKRILKRGVFTMSKYTKEEILKSAQENGVEFIRLQFTDVFGITKNVAITSSA